MTNPIFTALQYQKLLTSQNLTQTNLAKQERISRTRLSNLLRLLKLPTIIQNAVADNTLSVGHAITLLSFRTPAQQEALYLRIRAKNLSVRQVELLARGKMVNPSPNQAIIQNLRLALLSPVKISKSLKRGVITLSYSSQANLERILKRLMGKEEIERVK